MGMRKIVVLLISMAGALTMGLIWTVGQTGLSDTNAHLCELFSRYFPDVPENCQASDWIVSCSGYLFIFAICIMVLDIIWIFSTRSDKLPIAMPAAIQKAGTIEICFRQGTPYEICEIIHGRVKSTVRVGLRNSGGSALSNCRVSIESVSPPPAHVGLFPATLDGGSFVLRHDDPEKLVDVAFHWDHLNKYRFSTPVGGLTSAESLNYMNETEQRAFVIKFVATECQKSAMFKILVDDTKKLRLQYIGDAG